MHLPGCLDKPSSGAYRFAGRDISACTADELAWLRREAFGFVFQGYHHLIAHWTPVTTCKSPPSMWGFPSKNANAAPPCCLERLGLEEWIGHRPKQLSGGQQQHVCSRADEWRPRPPRR
jgi:macrolide transport system ATP-binding/permease protein